MKLPVYHHPRVEYALEAGFRWWAENRSAEQAANWFNGFVAALKSLGANPYRCPLAAEDSLFPYEIRQLNFGLGSKPTHRALYTIRPDRVYVFLIRHLSQQTITPDDLVAPQT